MKKTFILVHDMARAGAVREVQAAPAGFVVQIGEANRTLEQNAAQWPYLAGFAKQKQLCINGQMEWVTDEDWKDVLSACWNGEMRIASFDGRVILLPQRTSKMGKGVFSTWMEYLMAMAAQCGVEPVYKTAPRRLAA
jgi:hypothetical protein